MEILGRTLARVCRRSDARVCRRAPLDESAMTVAIGEEEFEREIPYVCEDCVLSRRIDLASPAFTSNPTPTWRSQ
jgi:hypothetical protein